MFAQTFVDTRVSARKPLTIALSVGIQALVVGALLIVPLLHPEILHPKFDTPLWVPLKLTPEPPRPMPAQTTAAPSASNAPKVFTAPPKIPTKIANIVDTATMAAEAPGIYIPGASSAGLTSMPGAALPMALPEVAPLKPAVRAQVKAPDGPVRVSGGVQAARLIFGPKPQYPTLAKTARVQGTVRLQAIIAADGHITQLQMLSGPGLLVQAAKDAVAQWRYQPTLLGGTPVEVLTEIDVVFTLN